MTNNALVIQDNHTQSFDANTFMTARNLVAKYCSTGSSAISAIKSEQYRCIIVSMDMNNEDPIEIIRALRHTEHDLSLPANQILVASTSHQPTHEEILKLNISGQILSHSVA